jgi:hypothetical protein
MTSEGDRGTLLALAGSALLFAQILIFEPIDIWAHNADSMIFPGALHAAALVGVLAVALTVVMAAWRLLPDRARRSVAAASAAVGLLAWFYAQFLFVDELQLNGRASPHHFATRLGALELGLLAMVVAGLAWLILRRPREALAGLAVLLAAQSALAAYQLTSTRPPEGRGGPAQLGALWRASRTGAVYVFVLDTLQADVAREVLRADPTLAAQFEGFRFFVNATGVGPTTYPSIPAIHSGAPWDPTTSLVAQYESKVRKRSFLAQLAANGYETSYVNPVPVCPDGTAVCTMTESVIGRRLAAFVLETARLLDLSLLRVMPCYWKGAIFQEGNLFLSPRVGDLLAGTYAEQAVQLLDVIAARTVVADGPPTAKFIHVFSTHPPFVLREDCTSDGRVVADGPRNAATCSLRRIALILARLKAGGAFDDALIVVMADHGGMRPLAPAPTISSAFTLLAAYATPTLMVKLPGQTGRLEESEAPVSIVDVAPTVCEVSGKCSSDGGRSLASASALAGSARRRVYHHYAWRAEYWSLARIPEVETYEITGPVRDQQSWRRIGSAPGFALGETIDFRDSATRDARGIGWAAREPWGTWTEGKRATMRVTLDPKPAGELTLKARARALVSDAQKVQLVDVMVNGRHLARWTFDRLEPVVQTLRIPADVLAGLTTVEIDFRIERPHSPKEMGLNGDPRGLGMGLIEARISAD